MKFSLYKYVSVAISLGNKLGTEGKQITFRTLLLLIVIGPDTNGEEMVGVEPFKV